MDKGMGIHVGSVVGEDDLGEGSGTEDESHDEWQMNGVPENCCDRGDGVNTSIFLFPSILPLFFSAPIHKSSETEMLTGPDLPANGMHIYIDTVNLKVDPVEDEGM